MATCYRVVVHLYPRDLGQVKLYPVRVSGAEVFVNLPIVRCRERSHWASEFLTIQGMRSDGWQTKVLSIIRPPVRGNGGMGVSCLLNGLLRPFVP